MAVQAVFWNESTGPAGKPGLLNSLRLDPDRLESAQGVIDAQLQDVRLGLYNHLGAARIDEILLTTYNENATTEAERTRLLANRVEAIWLRLKLLRVLPMLWMDDSSQRDAAWNEDAFSRERRDDKRIVEALESELAEGLSLLAGGDLEEDQSGFRVETIGPASTFYAGQTIRKLGTRADLSTELSLK